MKALLGIIVVVLLAGWAFRSIGPSSQPTAAPQTVAAAATIVPDLPSRHVSIAKTAWRRGGFDNVAFGTFSIRNDNPVPVKDVAIDCNFYGKSGTRIGGGSTVIYDTVAAKKTRAFPELSLGFIDQQADSASCDIVGVN